MVNNKLLLTSFLVLISKISVAESFSLRPNKNCSKELRLHVIRKQLSASFSSDDDTNLSRRQWLNDFAAASIGISSVFVPSNSAYASGGATAGGAYLLSAKQRYNARVLAGMNSFLLLSSSLEDGNLAESKAFFESEDEGGWKDSSAAGYLLANAFRRNSSTPPDNLPSVKVMFVTLLISLYFLFSSLKLISFSSFYMSDATILQSIEMEGFFCRARCNAEVVEEKGCKKSKCVL